MTVKGLPFPPQTGIADLDNWLQQLYRTALERIPDIDEMPSAGVADHGALVGLSDNDHPQYRLEADQITTSDIATGAVTSDELADDSVITDRILDRAVTAHKVAYFPVLLDVISNTATGAGSMTSVLADGRTSQNYRRLVPTDRTLYVLGVTATILTGASAGTYTVHVGVREYSDANSTSKTDTQLLTLTHSTVNERIPGADMGGTIESPLMSVTGGDEKEIRVYIENAGTSPGALGTSHVVTLYGFIV